VKFEWVNGGSAQTTWSVYQALANEELKGFPTSSSTYVVGQSMSHSVDFRAPTIQVGPEGDLVMSIQWASTGTAIGTLSLQYLTSAGWKDIPDAEDAFTTQPSNNTGNLVCAWTGLRAFRHVALRYVSTSGGSGNTSLAAQYVTT
jgi:hypothetical protein